MKTSYLSEPLHQYLLAHSVRQHPVQQLCQQQTANNPDHRKQIPPEQGQFFEVLVKVLRPKNILELGTFTGYSALTFALASPANTRIMTCDMNEVYLAQAAQYWQAAKVADKIEVFNGKASDCLDQLLKTPKNSFDLIFIDADKRHLIEYYEKALALLTPNGLLMVDNVLWHGDVVRDIPEYRYTEYVKAFNQHVSADPRVTSSMIAVGDGITLVTLAD